MHPLIDLTHSFPDPIYTRHSLIQHDLGDGSEDLARRLLSRLKFRDLNLLINIYELRSIRAASRCCNMSQTVGTKRLQEVEAALGIVLFIRSHTLLKPTPEAEVVYQACLQWKATTHSLAARLRKTQPSLSRRLTVGVGHSYLTAETIKYIQEAAEHFPMMDINVHVGSGPCLVQGLLNDSLDLAIGIPYSAHDEALISYDLPSIEVVPVASPGHPLLQELDSMSLYDKAHLTPERLSTHRWLSMPEGDPLSTALRQLFPEGVSKGLLELDSLPMVLTWMQIVPCLALLPKNCVESMAQRGAVTALPYSRSVDVEGYCLVHHRSKKSCNATTMLLQKFVPQAVCC